MFWTAPVQVPNSVLRRADRSSSIPGVQAEEPISRGEVTAMLFTFADINVKLARIIQLLEDEENGEEEAPGDDS